MILVIGAFTPVLLTWLGYLPYMTAVPEKVKSYLVYPCILGTYQVRSLPYWLGKASMVGQTLYIAVMVILNVVLTAADYKLTPLFAWYPKRQQELLAFMMYRTGIFAFTLAPLLLLFSSRNKFLLWLTNWSHSTYLLLHR